MEEIELTIAQKSFLDLEYIFPDKCVNNLHTFLFVEADVNEIEAAYNWAKSKNDVFCLRVGKREKEYFWKLGKNTYEELQVKNFLGNPQKYAEWLEECKTNQLFYENSSLYSSCIIIHPDGRCGLSFLTHHMLHDAYSVCLFLNQIENRLKNKNYDISVCSFVNYLKEREQNNLELIVNPEYWKAKISKYSEEHLYMGENDDLTGNTKVLKLSIALSSEIRGFCNTRNISVFSFFLGALFLYKWEVNDNSSQEVGIPILNRVGVKEKRTVGLFTNVLPLFIHINHEITLAQYYLMLRQEMNEFYKYRNSSYEEIKKLYEKLQNKTPHLFDVILSYQDIGNVVESNQIDWLERKTLVNPLLITILDRKKDEFIFRVEYRTSYISSSKIEKWIKGFENVVLKLINAAETIKLKDL